MMVGRLRFTVLPVAWVTMSAIWAVIMLVTEYPAWPLALWIATTVGAAHNARCIGRTLTRSPASA